MYIRLRCASAKPFARLLTALALSLLLLPPAARAQVIDGRFAIQVNEAAGSGGLDQLQITVQLKTQSSPANLGSVTLQFEYNDGGLEIPSAAGVNSQLDAATDYTYRSFAGAASDGDGSGYTSNMTRPQPNELSVNIVFSEGFSGGDGDPLPTTYTDVVDVFLDITDGTQTEMLRWTLQEVFAPDNTTQYPNGTFQDSDQALPVELVDFRAAVDGEAAVITWETASETNNAGFEIQLKRDSRFEQLGYEKGAGTTTEPQQYEYRADDLAPGTYAFRLKQIDFDGTFEYTPEVEVVVEMTEPFVLSSVYPNPMQASGTFSLAVARAQRVELSLFDVLGRRVAVLYDGEMQASRTREMSIDASRLARGIYFVRARGSDFVATRRVAVTR